MNAEERENLEKILGPGFTKEEVERFAVENPHLLRESEWLDRRMQALEEGVAPRLGEDFTQKVMTKIQGGPSWAERFGLWLNWRSAAVGGALAAAIGGLIVLPRFFGSDPAVQEARVTPAQQKVRFAIRLPEAVSVALAGDFNQWKPVPLQVSKQGDGTYSIEIDIAEGTHAYAFLVDGQRWMPDPASGQKVEDGFGGVNSLLTL